MHGDRCDHEHNFISVVGLPHTTQLEVLHKSHARIHTGLTPHYIITSSG